MVQHFKRRGSDNATQFDCNHKYPGAMPMLPYKEGDVGRDRHTQERLHRKRVKGADKKDIPTRDFHDGEYLERKETVAKGLQLRAWYKYTDFCPYPIKGNLPPKHIENKLKRLEARRLMISLRKVVHLMFEEELEKLRKAVHEAA